jgi:NAD(P)-dependent dehydrogenase (short-subunit alcohol dehydrogenase family)
MSVGTKPVVVITGASTGFGRLIAETLARSGQRVFATMRNVSTKNAGAARELVELAARESLWIRVAELDVTDDASVERAVGSVIDATGRIDVLVNNAGYGVMGPAEAFSVEQARRIMDTNFLGVVRMNRAVLPHMRAARSGLLMHISSGAGRVSVPGMSLYCASKWAMEAFAETSHYELAGLGIDSVIIEPGAYPTPVFDNSVEPADAARVEAYGAAKEIGPRVFAVLTASTRDPQEIADAVLSTIEMPAGQRPLRQRVGGGTIDGITALNEASAKLQAQVIEAFGLADLTKFRAT